MPDDPYKPKSTREILEDAIRANPDDGSAFAAYSDLLQEQDDPQGEFISLQLALEDEALPRDRRLELRERERCWLTRHEAGLLGRELTECRADPNARVRYQYHRGVLFGVEVGRMDPNTFRMLCGSPSTRLLNRLVIVRTVDDPNGVIRDVSAAAFRESIRCFQFGEPLGDYELVDDDSRPGMRFQYHQPEAIDSGEHAVELAAQFPRLETLLLNGYDVRPEAAFRLKLPELRTLRMYHFLAPVDLDPLVENPAMGNLETLLLHPRVSGNPLVGNADLRNFRRRPNLTNLRHLALRFTDIGNRGVEYLIRRGWLRQLHVLDLRHSRIGNAGGQLLAEAPRFEHLSRLDLACNRLTRTGVRVLQDAAYDTDVHVNLACQQHPNAGPAE